MLRKPSKAFTLIELLVVIAIIAILAVLIIIRIGTAVKESRDSRRLHDMDQITEALEVYKTKNGKYPDDDNDSFGWDTSYEKYQNGNPFIGDLVTSGIMSDVPIDPSQEKYTSWVYGYRYAKYWNGGGGVRGCDPKRGDFYVLAIYDSMETSDNPHPNSPGFSCNIDFSYGPLSNVCLDGGVYGTDCYNWQSTLEWVTGGFDN